MHAQEREKDDDDTHVRRQDDQFSFQDRAHIDWWNVTKEEYNLLSNRKKTKKMVTMNEFNKALETHRRWGGVDARRTKLVLERIKQRSRPPPIYAQSPEDDHPMPRDPSELPKFIKECKEEFDRDGCKTVFIHGQECKVLALYGMPFKPFQDVYDASSTKDSREACMAFGLAEALGRGIDKSSFLDQLAQETNNVTGPPLFAKDWCESVARLDSEAPAGVSAGAHNIVVELTNPDAIKSIFPQRKFWKSNMIVNDISPQTNKPKNEPLKDDKIQSRFLDMALSNGVVLRGSKPIAVKDPEIYQSGDGKMQYATSYKPLEHVCAEAFTMLNAAATGMHPPIFAMLIARYASGDGGEKGIMLTMMERGMYTLDSVKSLPKDDNSGFHESVAKHLGKRLSDLLYRSSEHGLLSIDTRKGNFLAMKPYRIPSLINTLKYNFQDDDTENKTNVNGVNNTFELTSIIPFDVMHIDCDPLFVCFIPKSICAKAPCSPEERASRDPVQLHMTNLLHEVTTQMRLKMQMRLSMLVLTVLNEFDTLLCDQLFTDIDGILNYGTDDTTNCFDKLIPVSGGEPFGTGSEIEKRLKVVRTDWDVEKMKRIAKEIKGQTTTEQPAGTRRSNIFEQLTTIDTTADLVCKTQFQMILDPSQKQYERSLMGKVKTELAPYISVEPGNIKITKKKYQPPTAEITHPFNLEIITMHSEIRSFFKKQNIVHLKADRQFKVWCVDNRHNKIIDEVFPRPVVEDTSYFKTMLALLARALGSSMPDMPAMPVTS